MADSIKAKMAALAQQRERLAAAQQRRQSQAGTDPSSGPPGQGRPPASQPASTPSAAGAIGPLAGSPQPWSAKQAQPPYAHQPVPAAPGDSPLVVRGPVPPSSAPAFQPPRPVLTKPAAPFQPAAHTSTTSRMALQQLASSATAFTAQPNSSAWQPCAGIAARGSSSALKPITRLVVSASPNASAAHAPVSSTAEAESFFGSDDASSLPSHAGTRTGSHDPAALSGSSQDLQQGRLGSVGDYQRTSTAGPQAGNGIAPPAQKGPQQVSSQSSHSSRLESPFAHASHTAFPLGHPDSLQSHSGAANGHAQPVLPHSGSVPRFMPHHMPAASQSHEEVWFDSTSPAAQPAQQGQQPAVQSQSQPGQDSQHAGQGRSAPQHMANATLWGNQGNRHAQHGDAGRTSTHPWAAAASTGLSPPPSQTESLTSSPGSTSWPTHLHMQHYSQVEPQPEPDSQPQDAADGSSWFDEAVAEQQPGQGMQSKGQGSSFLPDQQQPQQQHAQQWQLPQMVSSAEAHAAPQQVPRQPAAKAQHATVPSWQAHQQQQNHKGHSPAKSATAFTAPQPARSGSTAMQHAGGAPFARAGSAQRPWGSSQSLSAAGSATAHRDFPREGRPPTALLSFGFGGNAVLFKPRRQEDAGAKQAHLWQPAGGRMHDGRLQMLRLSTLAGSLALQQQDVQAQAEMRDDTADLLQRFPGPLTSSTPVSKVTAYLREKEQALAGQLGHMQELYGVLRLLAEHSGSLHTAAPGKASPSKDQRQSPEAALAGVLVPEESVQQNRPVLTLSPADSASSQQAADHMQHLLLSNQKAEAIRVAQQAGLWGPALLVARSLGDAAFQAAAADMAAATLASGQPLHTLSLLLAGQPPASILPPAPQPGPAGHERDGQAAAQDLLSSWRGNLAILGASGSPGSEALITQLGDRLWLSLGQAAAAHTCYAVAGTQPQALEPSARLCLPGADHKAHPRTFATSVAALQCSEVYEWARSQGNAAFAQQALTWLPYRLLYALHLAEHGQISAASGYAARLVQTLSSMQRAAPNLLVARSIATDLSQRLGVHASAFHITVQHAHSGSMLTSVGKWLDKGINKLMGGGSGPPSNTSSDSGLDPAAAAAANLGVRVTPSPAGPSPAGTAPSSPRTRGHQRSASAADVSAATHTNPVAHQGAASMDAASGPSSTGRMPGGLSMRSVLGKVGSIGTLLGGVGTAAVSSASAGTGSKEARIGEENTFYFDNELQQWRERGAPPPPPLSEVEPPPMAAKPPTQGAPTFASPARQPADVRSRYVDTMGTARSSTEKSASGSAAAAQQRTAFLPGPASGAAAPFFVSPSASGIAPTPPGPPKFFVPSAPRSSSASSLQGSAESQWQGFQQQRQPSVQLNGAAPTQASPAQFQSVASSFARAGSEAPSVVDAVPALQGTDYYTSYLDVQSSNHAQQQQQQQQQFAENSQRPINNRQSTAEPSRKNQQWPGQASTVNEAAFFDQQEMTELQL